MKVGPQIFFNAVNAADTQYSIAVVGTFLLYVSAQASFSSDTSAGTLKLQGSNDNQFNTQGGSTPQNWSDIPDSSQTITAGALTLIPKTDICYNWIRLVWTPSGGTGTITATGLVQGA